MSVLDDAVGQSFQHTPAIVPTVAAVPTQPEAAPTQLPTSAAAPATAASAAPSVLDNAINQSFTHTPPPVDTNSSKLEPAGAAGGALKPQAEATTGIMNLIGRGAEIMLGHPKGSLTGTISSEQPLSTSGEIGKVAGDTAQWMAAGGAVDKLGELAAVAGDISRASEFLKTPAAWAEYLKQSPKAAWLLKAIGGVAKGATTGAAVGGAQGAATGNTAKGAERGAALGGAMGAVAPVVEGAVSKIPNPWAAARAAARGETAAAGEQFSARPILNTKANEAAGTRAVQNVAQDTTEATRPSAATTPSAQDVSLRDVWNEPIAARNDVAKTYYNALDKASDNEWTANQNALKNVRKSIQMNGGLDEATDAKLNATKTRLEWQQDQIIDKVVKDGNMQPDVADKARSVWRAKSRLEDIQDIFNKKSNVSGVHPDMAQPGVKGLPAEKYNFKGIAKDLNAMDPKDLTQALGQDGAQNLISAVNLAARDALAPKAVNGVIKLILAKTGLGAVGHTI